MKGHRLSYILGGILIASAFAALFARTRLLPVTNKTTSWTLFVGGAILVIMGWKEQNEQNGKSN